MITRDKWILNRIREVFPHMGWKQHNNKQNLIEAYTCWLIHAGQDWGTFYIYMDKNNRTLIYGGVRPELVK